MTESKQILLQKVFERVLANAHIPAEHHFATIQALNKQLDDEREKSLQMLEEHKTRYEALIEKYEKALAPMLERDWFGELDDYLSRDWTGEKGVDGENAKAPTVDEIVKAILPKIPKPKNGKDAVVDENKIVARIMSSMPTPKDGENATATIDEEQILEKLVKKLQKEKPLDISHIRNAQTFVKDGIRYKVEELMRGASGSSTGSTTPIVISGTVDDSNTSFTAASVPNLVIINGASYRNGHGVTISGTAITTDAPVGSGGDICGL